MYFVLSAETIDDEEVKDDVQDSRKFPQGNSVRVLPVKSSASLKPPPLDKLPVESTASLTPPPLAKSAKMPAQETLDSLVASNKRQKLETSAAKPSVTKGNVYIHKGLTVTALPVKEQLNSEEDSALRSENARTPVGEEICSPQSQQQEGVVCTATDQIQQDEPEMAEEAPQLKSEQGTVDVPPEETPEFDYYGCEICKTEAKAYDRLSFTHKCPICPCMCFCSHLLKEHMRVIHGWFNIQRKFTQNY